MEWLSEWLKSVIMIVLFAAFVDLILPGKSMQRYARLVLSMLILLALLRPIINLLTVQPEKQLALELKRVESGPNIPKEAELESILAQAEKLKNFQQNQSLQWAGQEVAKQMKDQIASETGEEVGEVKVVLGATGESGASAVITSVEVLLREANAHQDAGRTPDDNDPKGVKPVDTIRVNVEMKPSKSSYSNAQKEEAMRVSKEIETRAGPVRDFLTSRWNLEPDQITIQFVESSTNTKL